MNVSLTPELEKFIENEVQGGMYQTASEVVRAGLRRLKDDKTKLTLRTPQTLDELEDDMLKAMKSIDEGRGEKLEDVFADLRKRSAARLQNA
jgi:antitoxin ParD1/3/4